MSSLRLNDISKGCLLPLFATAALVAALPGVALARGGSASTHGGGGVSHGGSSHGGGSHSGPSAGGGRYGSPHGGPSAGGTRYGSPGSRYGSPSGPSAGGTRYGVPRPGGFPGDPRQPHGGERGDHRGRGGWDNDWDERGFLGGWYDPWGYSWYGPGWGLGWSWGWGRGWWGYPGIYGAPYGYGYGYDGYGAYSRGYGGNGSGALDTDVSPEEAEVYVNGEKVGIADDFDGWPGYLWLPAGTYDVVFYLPGYQTLARQYTIYPGQVIDVTDHLERGQAVRPEDLPSRSTERRDERLRRNSEREADALRRQQWRGGQGMPPPAGGAGATPERMSPSLGQRGQASRVHVHVTPADASVYLDGAFIGTGAELGQLSAGLIVPPGNHRLEVVRPGYKPEDTDFQSRPGEDLEVKADLVDGN